MTEEDLIKDWSSKGYSYAADTFTFSMEQIDVLWQSHMFNNLPKPNESCGVTFYYAVDNIDNYYSQEAAFGYNDNLYVFKNHCSVIEFGHCGIYISPNYYYDKEIMMLLKSAIAHKYGKTDYTGYKIERCELSGHYMKNDMLRIAYSKTLGQNIQCCSCFVCRPSGQTKYLNYVKSDCIKFPDGSYHLSENVLTCPDCGKDYDITVHDFCHNCKAMTADTSEILPKKDLFEIDGEFYKEKPALEICYACGKVTNCNHNLFENIKICHDCFNNLDYGISYLSQYRDNIEGIISSYHGTEVRQHLYGLKDGQSQSQFKGFGFELEVDDHEWNACNEQSLINNITAHTILEQSGLEEDEVYFETDGSLNNGFEIISQPHTVEAFYAKKDAWCRMLEILDHATYKSHNGGSCGLHIHLSKTWFGNTETSQNYSIGKIYKFFDEYWDDLLKASRRNSSSRCFCDKNSKYYKDRAERRGKATPHAWQEQVKHDHDSRHNGESHHHALNNSNYATFEIRLGRGTLNKASFFAWIDFVLTFAKNAKKSANKLVSARDWLDGIKPSTAMYLLKRNCFIDTVKILHNGIYNVYYADNDSQE